MSRKYMNDRWCVRCGRTDPTPYLKKYAHLLLGNDINRILDLGCGNGRNTLHLRQLGAIVVAVDACPNVTDVQVCTLGHDCLPCPMTWATGILANYVLMFLDKDELAQVCREMKSVAAPGCRLMVELYPAKDSHCPTEGHLKLLEDRIFAELGRNFVRRSKNRFILQLC